MEQKTYNEAVNTVANQGRGGGGSGGGGSGGGGIGGGGGESG